MSSSIGGRFSPTPALDGLGTRGPASDAQPRIERLGGRDVQQTPDSVAQENRRGIDESRNNPGQSTLQRASAPLPWPGSLQRASAPFLTRTALATTPAPTSRGTLINATQFKAIAGETRNIFMGSGYKSLLKALDSYHREVVQNPVRLSDAEKLRRTEALQQQAQKFLTSKEEELSQKAGNAGDTARIEARMLGTKTLLQGLHDESRALYGRLTGHDMAEAAFVPENEIRVEAGFAAGSMSSVDKIRYRDGTVGVFKAEGHDGPMPHDVGRSTGIPARLADANMSGRAVATYKLDGALGLGLVPRTEFAVHDARDGCVQEFVPGEKLLGRGAAKVSIENNTDIMMDILSGENQSLGHGTDEIGARRLAQVATARPEVRERVIRELMEGGHLWATREQMDSMGPVDLSAPSVQKSLADAHVLDLLTAQVDRNPGNFIFEAGADGHVRAKLIDNDLSFGGRVTALDRGSLGALRSPVMIAQMPRLIDADTARRVGAMTPDALRSALADTGLSEEEVDAATARLGQLQAHIRLVGQGQVPGARLVDNWDAATFRDQMTARGNYVQRSADDLSEGIREVPGKHAMLVDDVRNNGARGLAGLVALWDANRTNIELRQDLATGGRLVKALLEAEPRVLTDMLAKISADDRGEVLRAYRGRVVTDTPRAARNAAEIAAELAQRGVSISGSNGGSPMLGRELTSWTLNALLGMSPTLGEPSPNAGGTMAPHQFAGVRAAAIHQAFTNGSLSMNMVDELIDTVRLQLGLHDGWNDGDLEAIDRNAANMFHLPRAVALDPDDTRSLFTHTIFSELGKLAGRDPRFASYMHLLDDIGSQAMPAYNREGGLRPGAEKVVVNGPDFAREGAKITPALLHRLRTADTADSVRTILREQGWEASDQPRSALLGNAVRGGADGMNDFLARYMLRYAEEGHALAG